MRVCQLHYEALPCQQCQRPGFSRQQPANLPSPSYIAFHEAVYEHLYDPWEKPVEITTPAKLAEECQKRGLYSHYLRDSQIWRVRSRWV